MRSTLRYLTYSIGLLLAFLACSTVVRAQGTPGSVPPSVFTTEGREFWVCFEKNFRDLTINDKTQAQEPAAALELTLFISCNTIAHITLDIAGLGIHKNLTVAEGRVLRVPIDSAVQIRSSEVPENLAVHIISDQPVAVYGLNHRYQTTDTYLAYPVNVLGKSYRVMCYRWLQNDLLSQFAVVATENNTHVKITPSVKTQKGKPAGVPFEFTLNRGEVYQVIPTYDPNTNSDLTGSLIEADAPVAVFSGHNCAYVPNSATKACNNLVEQMPSLQSWGKQFFVGTLAGRSSSVFRVLSTNDNTQIFENGKLVATLRAGEFYENPNQTQQTLITASQPVLVAQYSKGFDNGDNVGDPMMIIIAPTEQFLSAYRFATPETGSWHHYINVVVPTDTIESVKLDGRPLDPNQFHPFGLSRYSIGQFEVPYGTHIIQGAVPFGLYSYGFGYDEASYDAYGNGGGQSMDVIVEKADTMAPTLDIRQEVAGPTMTVIARDDRVNDKGLSSIDVVDYENLKLATPTFESGSPLVAMPFKPVDPHRNAYALYRLRDRAGNSSLYTICARYDEAGDTMVIRVLPNGQSCDFAPKISYGGFLKYSVLNNNVTIAANSEINNPVELVGSHGAPEWGIGAIAEYPYRPNLFFTGRLGIDLWNATAFGYMPLNTQLSAADGTPIHEEFELDRSALMVTLGAGAQYFLVERKGYLFGLLNIGLPVSVTETLTRTIMSPSNYLYENGRGSKQIYSGSGPSGFAIVIAPEAGIGTSVDLRYGLRLFGELGAGTSLTSLSPDRSWGATYFFARMGAKAKF